MNNKSTTVLHVRQANHNGCLIPCVVIRTGAASIRNSHVITLPSADARYKKKENKKERKKKKQLGNKKRK